MLRVLVGILIGLGYGAFVGAVLFLIYAFTGDPPVDLMLDYAALFRFLTLLAMIITGSLGAFVGFIVSLLRLGKIKAGIIGFGLGSVVLTGVLFKIWPQLKTEQVNTWPSFSIVFLFLLLLILMFPMGLAATGLTASVVARKWV